MRSHSKFVTVFLAGATAVLGVIAAAASLHAAEPPQTIRDLLWVWGNPEMTTDGHHTLASFASAGSAERAKLLGTPNVALAGTGVPNDDAKADALTAQVAGFKRLIWEVTPDGKGLGPPFVYQKRMAQIRTLFDKYPQLEGVLLDDMSTGKIDRGFKPEHLRHIREQLPGKYQAIKIWGVVYTMSFDRKGMNDYLKDIDVINLWLWHAKDIVDIDKYVAHCEQVAPGKPIYLGVYLYDYGGGQRMSLDMLQRHCEAALRLAHARRVAGIVFLTITNDPEAVGWTAEWIKQVGGQKIGSPAAPVKVSLPASSYPRSIPGALSWIAGRDGSILMCAGQRIARSTDGGDTWQDVCAIQDGKPNGYFTRLPDGSLLMVVSTGEGDRQIGWIRSDDDGRTWSEPTPIVTLQKHWYFWGPVCVMQDGRWGYCPYFEEVTEKGEHVRTNSMLLWSNDQGKTWSEPIVFPKAADGNRGLTEMTVAQFGPQQYFAAIRADDTTGSWDGFYWSESSDGLNWSAPASFDERGRMPLIYKLKNGWALAYRQYDAEKGTQHSAIRFSRDGRTWSKPLSVETGVNAMPQLVELSGRIVVFNTLYPVSEMVTRHVIDAAQLNR